jgi:hypothetical protein
MGITPQHDNPNEKVVFDRVNAELEWMADGKKVRDLNINGNWPTRKASYRTACRRTGCSCR